MRCPECGQDGAYTGLQWVHCQNKDCRYYDKRYVEKLKAERELASFYDKVEKLILLRGKVQEPEDT